MRALAVVAAMGLFVALNGAGVPLGSDGTAWADDAPEERMGQDPAPPGTDLFGEQPGKGDPGERVGNDPDVPGGDVPGTPEFAEPGKREGQDPDVPIGEEIDETDR